MLRSILVAAGMAAGCLQAGESDYEIVAEYAHDPSAYTQGLLFHDGWMVESTGQYGESDVRRFQLESGQVQVLHELSPERFGEGLTLVDDHLYQLTWKAGIGYVYQWPTGALVDSFTIDGEGWGLTFDGANLIMSDGSAQLRFLDPQTFEVVRTVDVTDDGQPVTQLNELEFVKGRVLANVYRTDWIVSIDPGTGAVEHRYSLRGLQPYDQTGSRVLNGIAHDAVGDRLFVTGKYWPTIFQIRLLPVSQGSPSN